MQLKIVGTGSSGNSYILENESEALLIECGVRFQKTKVALKFQTAKVVGCLITHEHMDHCKGVIDVLAAGINVYSTAGTLKAMAISSHHRAKPIAKHQNYTLGGFTFQAFGVQHDAMEPVGFMIHHEETGNVLFLTDTYYVAYTFPPLHNIIVEANYSQEIIDQKVRDGVSPEFLRNRVLESHMSLKTCKELLQANDLRQTNNIVLIHLSDSNSNAEQFKKEVQAVTGKSVFVAAAGMKINFNKQPF